MTARQLRIFELILVLTVAFIPAILSSISFLITGEIGSFRQKNNLGYVIWISDAILSIVLLYYVLLRNNKNFGHIGFNLTFTAFDLFIGIALMVVSWFFMAIVSGPIDSISYYLYGHGVTPQNTDFFKIPSVGLILIISIVMPLTEELIVRGFTMTEIFDLTENKKMAVAISVLIQFTYHLYQGVPSAINLLPYFILVSIYFVRTANLNAVVVSHILFDFIGLLMRR